MSLHPYFDFDVPRNVTARVGQTAFLRCHVEQLGDKSVSHYKYKQKIIDSSLAIRGTFTSILVRHWNDLFYNDAPPVNRSKKNFNKLLHDTQRHMLTHFEGEKSSTENTVKIIMLRRLPTNEKRSQI